MRITTRSGALIAAVALLLGAAFAFHGIARAGDDVPAAKPATSTEAQPATSEKPATATPSPMHSVMKWIGSQVMPGAKSPCPSTEAGEKAWRNWYAAQEGPLTGLRDALVADGWTADRFVGFFQKLASQKSCSDCPEGCSKAAKGGASAPTGDAGATGSSSCDGSGCNKAKKSCCGGCKEKAEGASAPTGDAGATGSSSCDGSGCDKAKKSCGGCKKKAEGAAAPTGDAGTTGAGSCDGKCPCTGKNKAECEGCDKPGCPCGK